MSDAVSGFGTFLQRGDGAGPEVFTTIAEVKDITGPGLSADIVEVTNHSSIGAFKEKLSTLLDGGEVTFDVNFLPGNATQDATDGLLSAYMARSKDNYKLIWPTVGDDQVAFKAQVTGFEPTAPVEEALTASVTLTLTGPPTFS
jgi:predicted secreted protein